jgi:hypothetical protein
VGTKPNMTVRPKELSLALARFAPSFMASIVVTAES